MDYILLTSIMPLDAELLVVFGSHSMALSHGSQKNVKGILHLSLYSEDSYALEHQWNMVWYSEFQKLILSGQKQLLDLWMKIGIPFKKKKQISGLILTIIRIEVNTNNMTFT